MHQIHHTLALVLATSARAEADKTVHLYTKDFGHVRAHARGMRLLFSKSRYALQSYSLVKIDLIQTRAGWRVGSVTSLATLSPVPSDVHKVLYKISDLLRRLAPEEEKNEELYEAISDAFVFLQSSSGESVATAELLTVYRILYFLGYISTEEKDLVHVPFTQETLEKAEKQRKVLVEAINSGLRETMMVK